MVDRMKQTHSQSLVEAVADVGSDAYHKIAHLESINAELHADSLRYRWLKKNACWGYPSSEGSDNKDAYLIITGYGYKGDVDAVIDAEMEQRP